MAAELSRHIFAALPASEALPLASLDAMTVRDALDKQVGRSAPLQEPGHPVSMRLSVAWPDSRVCGIGSQVVITQTCTQYTCTSLCPSLTHKLLQTPPLHVCGAAVRFPGHVRHRSWDGTFDPAVQLPGIAGRPALSITPDSVAGMLSYAFKVRSGNLAACVAGCGV